MKWTEKPPTKNGYYWVLFKVYDIHQQGPMVYEVEIDDGDLILTEPGGDYMMGMDIVERDHGPVKYWSDEPIVLPEEGIP